MEAGEDAVVDVRADTEHVVVLQVVTSLDCCLGRACKATGAMEDS